MQNCTTCVSFLAAMVIFLHAGCSGNSKASNGKIDNDSQAITDSLDALLTEFQTVADDESARAKLPALTRQYDGVAARFKGWVESMKKSYAFGKDVTGGHDEMMSHCFEVTQGISKHKKSLPDSTIEILQPFFDHMKQNPMLEMRK